MLHSSSGTCCYDSVPARSMSRSALFSLPSLSAASFSFSARRVGLSPSAGIYNRPCDNRQLLIIKGRGRDRGQDNMRLRRRTRCWTKRAVLLLAIHMLNQVLTT